MFYGLSKSSMVSLTSNGYMRYSTVIQRGFEKYFLSISSVPGTRDPSLGKTDNDSPFRRSYSSKNDTVHIVSTGEQCSSPLPATYTLFRNNIAWKNPHEALSTKHGKQEALTECYVLLSLLKRDNTKGSSSWPSDKMLFEGIDQNTRAWGLNNINRTENNICWHFFAYYKM